MRLAYSEADRLLALAYHLHPSTVAAARRIGALDRLLVVAARRAGLPEAQAA